MHRLPFVMLMALIAVAACAPEERDDRLGALARWEDRRLAPADSLDALLEASDPIVRRAARIWPGVRDGRWRTSRGMATPSPNMAETQPW